MTAHIFLQILGNFVLLLICIPIAGLCTVSHDRIQKVLKYIYSFIIIAFIIFLFYALNIFIV